MNDISIRQGSALNIQVNQGDTSAISATLIIKLNDNPAISVTDTYVDGVANLTLSAAQTSVVGIYDYQVNENYEDGAVVKYPADDCDDCDFPKLEICESLDGEVS